MSTPIRLEGKSRTCPTEARTIYFFPKKRPTVRALAGDSTITILGLSASLPLDLDTTTCSSGSRPSWAGVRPILNIFVPHTGHIPCVAGAPLIVNTGRRSLISRLALHLTQYACISTSTVATGDIKDVLCRLPFSAFSRSRVLPALAPWDRPTARPPCPRRLLPPVQWWR